MNGSAFLREVFPVLYLKKKILLNLFNPFCQNNTLWFFVVHMFCFHKLVNLNVVISTFFPHFLCPGGALSGKISNLASEQGLGRFSQERISRVI